jgi:uncharacterized protein YndB with AHSA1/START domain
MANDLQLPCIEHMTYIAVSPEVVYQTITTAEGWDSWFTNGTTIEPKPGGQIQLRWENFGAGRWTTEDGGSVLNALPNRRFVFQWTPGKSTTTVSFTLEAIGEGTLLKLVESGYSLSEQDLAAFVGCAAGWGEALTLLKYYLEHGVRYGKVPDKQEKNTE